jgi:hypothetical protein
MDHQFKLPNESAGNGDSARRVSDLIEEIRADIDFELDDAVTDIVRDLPEEYFQRMNHETQVSHFKGLIASRICQLNGELFLPSADGTQVAVLGRKSYRGQLANILSELPGKKTRLVGANIYTARSHGFILDVFEFESDQQPSNEESFSDEVIQKIVDEAGSDSDSVTDFLSRIRTTSVKSPNTAKLTRFFQAFTKVKTGTPVVADQYRDESGFLDLVVAVRSFNERPTFQGVSESLARISLDIEQAELVVVRFEKGANEPESQRSEKVVLMNFIVSTASAGSFQFDAWADSLAAALEIN